MNLDLAPVDRAFRDEVRRFLAKELPIACRNATAVNISAFFEYDVSHPWHERLFRKGWAAPGWPVEYGGTGWSPIQQYIWRMESWRAGAPVISQLGMRLVAPALIEFGTLTQKARFLPEILSGASYWCQGFSEPGAGSDLAALSCAAILDGDEYVVNGTKLWQTHAHYADWMILLVRTKSGGKPQDGITCLLVEMLSDGIEVQPIITAGGDHEVNQIFLDGVRIPVASRVGAEGEGWTIAKHLLTVERGSNGNIAARLRWLLMQVKRMLETRSSATAAGLADGHASGDDPLRARLAELAIDVDTIEMLELQALQADAEGVDPGIAASIIKLQGSVIEQDLNQLAVDLLGEDAVRWNNCRPLHQLDEDQETLESLAVMPRYLNSRARTIFGGSTEVQLNIIAKSLPT